MHLNLRTRSCWVHTTSAFNPNNFYGQETNYFAQNGRSTIAVMLLCVPPRVTLSAQWSDGGVKLLAESTMRPLKCMSDPTNLA